MVPATLLPLLNAKTPMPMPMAPMVANRHDRETRTQKIVGVRNDSASRANERSDSGCQRDKRNRDFS
jgi:hypothetical protein